MFRESVRDFMVNQQFRRDYWVKGARRITPLEQIESLRQQRVVLVTQRADVSLKVTGALGEATMSEEVYAPILDLMSDHKIRTIGQIELAVKDKGVGYAQVLQAVILLSGANYFAPVQDETVINKARKQTEKLNAWLLQKARSSNDISYLASPVTGGGIMVGRFQQLFLLAIGQGKKQPADWAAAAWQLLFTQSQKLIKEGKALESAEENLAELTAQAQIFAEKQLPILKALQIA